MLLSYSTLRGGLLSLACVIATASPAYALPVAVDDYYETERDVSLVIDVADMLANDYDTLGAAFYFADYVDDPESGTVSYDASAGVVTFTPFEGFVGEGYFTYGIYDGNAGYDGWSWALVHVDITSGGTSPPPTDGGTNTPPTGVNDSFLGQMDVPVTITFAELLANDIDPDGDTLQVLLADDPIHGTVNFQAAQGFLVFTPDPGFTGDATFYYTVSDGNDGGDWAQMGFANVTIAFSPSGSGGNQPPVAGDDAGFMTLEGEDLVIGYDELLANDSDPDGDVLDIVGTTNGSGGVASLDPTARTITFVPGQGASTGSFTYTVSDGALTATATVDLTIVESATLTVSGGSGSGSYIVGTEVMIQADPAPSGQVFSAWVGDVASVLDASAAATTVVVTDNDLAITATYAAPDDTQPPSVPTGLVASGIGSSSLSFDWNPSTDNVSVAGYRLMLDGALVAQPAGTSATVTGLNPQTTYSVQVAAVDGAGNASANSASLVVTTLASSSPDVYNAFFFGHSLVNHRSVDHNLIDWAFSLAQDNGQFLSADGEYGFLPDHVRNLPVANGDNFFGVAQTPSGWGGSFGASDYDAAVITTGNFLQNWVQPTESYWADNQPTGQSPVDHAITMLDYVRAQEPSIELYIYAHWPEFPLAGVDFPTDAAGLAQYHAYTRGDFHDWWLTLQDEILAVRPNSAVKLIPAGYIIAGLLTQFPDLAAISSTELYEDSAPHGEPTIYFLTGLVHYMVFYGQPPATDYTVPSAVHPAVAANFDAIVSYVWDELSNFNHPDGTSRVF